MLVEEVCCLRDRFLCRDGAVCPHFQCELVIVGDLTQTGVLYVVVYFQDWGIDTIYCDDINWSIHHLLVALRRDIASATINDDFHIQLCAFSQGCDVHTRVEDIHFRVGLDVAGGNFALALGFDINRFRSVAVELCGESLQAEDDLGHILFHTGNRTQFMVYAINLHGIHSHTGQ